MQSNSLSTDRQKEKQNLINSIWDSLFGGDVKKQPCNKMDINSNRRLYMIGLEDFSTNSDKNRVGELVNIRKTGEENVNRKQTIRNSKKSPDSNRKSLGYSERPPSSKDAEHNKQKLLRNEKINLKKGDKNVKQVDDIILKNDKDRGKGTLKKEKMKKDARQDGKKNTNDLPKRKLEQQSKVSFNLNHLPEDSKQRSEIIAHVIERVDSLKKRMQDEKSKLDNSSEEHNPRRRSSSVGKTSESPSGSVKTIYWPKCENRPIIDNHDVCNFNNVKDSYFNSKRLTLEKLSNNLEKQPKHLNEKPTNIGGGSNNPERTTIENREILESKSIQTERFKQENVEELKVVSNNNRVCPDREIKIIKELPQDDLKQKSILKIKLHSASDTSISSSKLKNNRFEEGDLAGLSSNKLLKIMDEIKFDDNNKKDEDAKGQNDLLDIPTRNDELNRLDFGVFNVEIRNDDISTLFIMESNVGDDNTRVGRKEASNHFLARDGSGERGHMKNSCEVETPKSDNLQEAKHDTSTELQPNNTVVAKNDSENTKSNLIQSFMEFQESDMNTPPSSHVEEINNDYELKSSDENDDNLPTRENKLELKNSTDLVPALPHSEGEPIIIESSVGDIFKLKNYIPASQRKIELKAYYIPRLVSISFCMQVASCYKIVVQFDKSLTCETFPNQGNNVLFPERKKMVQFVEFPEFDIFHSDSNLSETSELILDLLDEEEEEVVESVIDNFKQDKKIVKDIETKSGKCSSEVQFYNIENDKIEPLNAPVTTISNPVYVVIMNSNERASSSLGRAEICKIESPRFSEFIFNEISGVNKKLVVGSEERPKSAKSGKKIDTGIEKNSVCSDKLKKSSILPQSKDRIKSRASSVCLPSGLNKSHTKKYHSSLPRVRLSQSNVVINRPKKKNQVTTVSNQDSDVKNKVTNVKNETSSVEPPEYLNSQLISIRDEIRELKTLFAKR
ncbi:uncharacterized protein LOC111053907 [Nilaparvata lugens]|uniref:uncharacterized protein LOC111053907 n=1 Tax=Nilaparvata lugens TaxID=108931 RepID=UPI00193E3538|nr:uncharacterized protein LOC111053907 [Nilaparvata lugens]